MTSSIPNRMIGRALRVAVCAALALATTSITTQVIVSSAGEHEYGIAPTNPVADRAAPDISRRITVARLR
jgi:hypothetical protein